MKMAAFPTGTFVTAGRYHSRDRQHRPPWSHWAYYQLPIVLLEQWGRFFHVKLTKLSVAIQRTAN